MPLPQKVIEQLGREKPQTPGWAIGSLLFSGGILFLTIAIYLGLTYGYEPYLQSQITKQTDQVNLLDQSISTADQSSLINFYSQIANLKTLLQGHVISSQFFTWLEQNTEANVYYDSLALGQANHVTLDGIAKTEADVNQQLSIFENSKAITSVNVSNVTFSQQTGGGWTFNVILVMAPSLFQQANAVTH
jgi:Tfp pilus assembly protein PilN